MAQSIKFNDNNYMDASGVWDSNLGMSQKDINTRIVIGVISDSITDYNNVPNGIWYIDSSKQTIMANRPSDLGGGICYVVCFKLTDENMQFIFNPSANKIYVRSQYGSWRSWRSI